MEIPEHEREIYNNLKDWQKEKVTKFYKIMRLTEGMKGEELVNFLKKLSKSNPDIAYNHGTYYRHMARYKERGIQGIIPQYGKTKGATKIKEEWYEFYKTLFLREDEFAIAHCWEETRNYAQKLDKDLIINDFPIGETFDRLLKNRVSEEKIYKARHGEVAWRRKYKKYNYKKEEKTKKLIKQKLLEISDIFNSEKVKKIYRKILNIKQGDIEDLKEIENILEILRITHEEIRKFLDILP